MVRLLQLLLPHLSILGTLLILLQFPDVVYRSLENGAFIPAHLSVIVAMSVKIRRTTEAEDKIMIYTPNAWPPGI